MSTLHFKYFAHPMKDARFTDEPCGNCGSSELSLKAEYFDRRDDIEAVCMNCLITGKVTVEVPNHVVQRLSECASDTKVSEAVTKLQRTPPVPWIQHNEWPVCCSDFIRYIGEWSREDFAARASNGNGKEFLVTLLDESTKKRVVSVDGLWEELGDETVAFVFECTTCSKLHVVLQSY